MILKLKKKKLFSKIISKQIIKAYLETVFKNRELFLKNKKLFSSLEDEFFGNLFFLRIIF